MKSLALSGGKSFSGIDVVSKILSQTDLILILPVKDLSRSIQIDHKNLRVEIFNSWKLFEQIKNSDIKIVGNSFIHTPNLVISFLKKIRKLYRKSGSIYYGAYE